MALTYAALRGQIQINDNQIHHTLLSKIRKIYIFIFFFKIFITFQLVVVFTTFTTLNNFYVILKINLGENYAQIF